MHGCSLLVVQVESFELRRLVLGHSEEPRCGSFGYGALSLMERKIMFGVLVEILRLGLIAG